MFHAEKQCKRYIQVFQFNSLKIELSMTITTPRYEKVYNGKKKYSYPLRLLHMKYERKFFFLPIRVTFFSPSPNIMTQIVHATHRSRNYMIILTLFAINCSSNHKFKWQLFKSVFISTISNYTPRYRSKE